MSKNEIMIKPNNHWRWSVIVLVIDVTAAVASMTIISCSRFTLKRDR
jgi:hypothetical protein